MHNRIIALILFSLIILSVVYVFFGKNWLTEQQLIQKYRNNQFVRNELMKRLNEIQQESQQIISDVLKQDYDLKFFTTQEINLKPSWEFEINHELICPPLFDHKQIYILQKDKLIILDKNGVQIKQKTFSFPIRTARLLDANRLLLLLENGEYINMDRNSSKIFWRKKDILFPPSSSGRINLDQISLSEYGRLEDSLILITTANRIEIYNNLSGKRVASFISVDIINSISDFDLQEKCVYLETDKEIKKILFEVNS